MNCTTVRCVKPALLRQRIVWAINHVARLPICRNPHHSHRHAHTLISVTMPRRLKRRDSGCHKSSPPAVGGTPSEASSMPVTPAAGSSQRQPPRKPALCQFHHQGRSTASIGSTSLQAQGGASSSTGGLSRKASLEAVFEQQFPGDVLQKTAIQFCSAPGLPSPQQALKIPFKKLSEMLRSREVIEKAGAFLAPMLVWCNVGPGDKPGLCGTVNAKIFLAAYMMEHPQWRASGESDELERKMIDSTTPMLNDMYETAQALAAGVRLPDIEAAKRIPETLPTYLMAFKNWKIVDERILAGRLRNSLIAIDKLIQEAKDSGDENALKELESHRTKLCERLSRFCPASDEAQSSKRRRTDPPSSAGEAQGGAMGQGGGQGGTPTIRTVVTYCEEPPKRKEVQGLTNLQLVYELLVDKDFQLKDFTPSPDDQLVHTKIAEVYDQAYWESLGEDVGRLRFNGLFEVLDGISKRIQGISEYQSEVQEMGLLDLQHIREQTKVGAYTLLDFMMLGDSIYKLLLRMWCQMKAVKRQEEIQRLWKEVLGKCTKEGVTDGKRVSMVLQFLENQSRLLRTDYTNNKLRALVPVIHRDGLQYVQGSFAKMYPTTEKTVKWVAEMIAAMKTEFQQLAEELLTRDDASVAQRYQGIIRFSLLGLVVRYKEYAGDQEAEHGNWPETAILEFKRFEALQFKFHGDVVSAMILLQVRGVCGSLVKEDTLQKIEDVLKANHPYSRLKLNQAVETILALLGVSRTWEDGKLDNLKALIDKHTARSNIVYTAMSKKFVRGWFSYLTKDSAGSVQSNLSSVPAWLIEQTCKHARCMEVIVDLNLKLHGERYDKILNEIFN